MSAQKMNILEQLKTLTQIETAELVKQIETTFRVNASPPQIPRWKPIADDSSYYASLVRIESESKFDVVLEEVPADKKIAILKEVRALLQLSLWTVKDIVESVPGVVKEGINRDEAEEIKQQLESAGAKVSLREYSETAYLHPITTLRVVSTAL